MAFYENVYIFIFLAPPAPPPEPSSTFDHSPPHRPSPQPRDSLPRPWSPSTPSTHYPLFGTLRLQSAFTPPNLFIKDESTHINFYIKENYLFSLSLDSLSINSALTSTTSCSIHPIIIIILFYLNNNFFNQLFK